MDKHTMINLGSAGIVLGVILAFVGPLLTLTIGIASVIYGIVFMLRLLGSKIDTGLKGWDS